MGPTALPRAGPGPPPHWFPPGGRARGRVRLFLGTVARGTRGRECAGLADHVVVAMVGHRLGAELRLEASEWPALLGIADVEPAVAVQARPLEHAPVEQVVGTQLELSR